ncbi:MAG TPA: M23 family metallopeptidase [Pyrinomonadaceae bacterium]|jgi:murein DD-endopeptidase MepM/ murein hydrolase activator NlpD
MIQTAKVKKIAFILYLAALHALAAFFIYERINRIYQPESAKSETLNPVVPLPSPVSIPFEANNLPPENKLPSNNSPESPQIQQETSLPQNSEAPAASEKLMIPVIGIKREDLQDTYTQSRSGGRVHNAIDIMAPAGAPVVAAADGEIAKFFDSQLGGITIYQWSADKKFVYYYAHLQRRADNLQEKSFVKKGQIIGYVGDTGNSGAGNYHLHFSIIVPTTPNRHWDGTNVNPYPILKEGIEAPAR